MNDGCAGTDHHGQADDTSRQPIVRHRALVHVERRQRARSASQAPAVFVAQLIACNGRLGDFRRARRQTPESGTGRYAEVPRPAAPHLFETEA